MKAFGSNLMIRLSIIAPKFITFHAESPVVLTLQSGRRGTAAVGLTPQSVGKIFAARTIILPKLPVYLYGEAGYQLSAVNIDTGSLSPH